jgi:hypothetical protein
VYTLLELKNSVKRRIRQLAAAADATVEVERGNLLSNNTILGAINAGRKALMGSVVDARLWGNATTSFTTQTNLQDYDIGKNILKVLAALYDVVSAQAAGLSVASVAHSTGSVTVTGFSGLTPSAWAGGYLYLGYGALFYSARIITNDTTTVTIATGTDLPNCTATPCVLRTSPATSRQSTTVEMADLKTAMAEEAAIRDPMNYPSATNPKFRMAKSKFRVVVSTDGSVTSGKIVQVECIMELADLSADGDSTGLPMTLDEMVMDWAVYEVCSNALPEQAILAQKTFYQKAQILNGGA